MKKIKVYKGFVIALEKESGFYAVFFQDEWSMGEGFRTAEMDGIGTIQLCQEFIDCY
ncbi:MAG: hypothetical protein K1X72_04390 [Pyrinomonadaceae bacterium]|nr:hypothetical protein [Pyrinomonadaceae bacterium]